MVSRGTNATGGNDPDKVIREAIELSVKHINEAKHRNYRIKEVAEGL